ncbi:MAG: carbohydrate-binding family 9-like protein [Paludibacter sp.]|nr:carbohydrate-binding family 9-like protein [Paludibacter sp.]
MKTIHIPYLQKLDIADAQLAADLLEEDGVKATIRELNWPDQYPYRPITIFSVGYSSDSIFIKYSIRGNILKAIYEHDNEPVYEDSCVEFFCKLPNSRYYFNFEFNCIGTCLAAKRRERKEDVVRFSTEDLKKISRYSSIGKRAFNEMQGLFEWELTVKIPFEMMEIEPDKLPDRLLVNFYKCATDSSDYTHYVSWSPIDTPEPDFHRPEFFGEMIFDV